MRGFDFVFQLFGLLLGLAIAELLAGFARTWRFRSGAMDPGGPAIRVGKLVPLLGVLVITDQTRFWVTAYALRDYIAFNYLTLLAVLSVIGGYYLLSTFVFPRRPDQWPDFDLYYLKINRIVIGGMLAVNLVTFLYGLYLWKSGVELDLAAAANNRLSLLAAILFLPGLVALFLVKSPRANFVLLLAMNVLLLVEAVAQAL